METALTADGLASNAPAKMTGVVVASDAIAGVWMPERMRLYGNDASVDVRRDAAMLLTVGAA